MMNERQAADDASLPLGVVERRLILFFCFMAALVDGVDAQTLALTVPLMAREWGAPVETFGLAFVAFSVGLIAGSVGAGWTADKVGRKITLLVSVLLVGSFTSLVPLTNTVTTLSLARLVTGAGVGGALVCIIAICTQALGREAGARAALLVYVGAPVGYLAASLGGSPLLETGNWRLLFYIAGILPIVVGVAMYFLLPQIRLAAAAGELSPGASSASREKEGLFGGTQTARTLMLWLVMLLSFSATYLLISWLPSLLTLAGMSAANAARSGSVIFVGTIFGTLAFAAISARFSIGTLLTWAFALGTAAALLLHFLGAASGPAALVALLLLGMALIGGQIALMVFSASLYPDAYKGRGAGWAVGIGRIGSLLGPALGAVLIGWGLSNSTFLVLAGLLTACTVTIAVLNRMLRRQL